MSANGKEKEKIICHVQIWQKQKLCYKKLSQIKKNKEIHSSSQ